MAKILVTGGAGFIGSHLVEALQALGHHIRIIDDYSSGSITNLPKDLENISLCRANIARCDPGLLEKKLDGVDIVYHLAAQVSVQASIENPEHTIETNVLGTERIIRAAKRAGISKIVFSSTAAVYGDEPTLPKNENSKTRPQSPYAETKLEGERIIKEAGIDYQILRFFNVYGPRQNPKSAYSGVISIFADRLKRGKQCTIFGDGEQTRDFVYVGDVVNALLLAGNSKEKNKLYVIGTGEQTTLNSLYKTLCELTHVDTKPKYAEERQGDIRHSVASIQRAEEELGYTPSVSLKEGLRSLLEHKP